MELPPIFTFLISAAIFVGVFALIVYLRSLATNRLKSIFQQISRETGLQYFEPEKNFWREKFPHLDGYLLERKTYIGVLVKGSGKSRRYYWNIKLDCQTDNYTFGIWKEGFSSKVSKFFGGQDIEIGVEDFDKQFIIRGNQENFVRRVLNNNIRRILQDNRKRLKGEMELKSGQLSYEEMTHGFVMSDVESIKSMIKILERVSEQAEIAYRETEQSY